MIRESQKHARPTPSPSNTGRAACEAALRDIAQNCEAALKRHIRPAARGDATSLHRVRIALTRLRTAIRFFRPVIDHRDWKKVQDDARWLSRRAGKARDLDVALARRKGATHRSIKRWRRQRERRYEGLRAALHLVRYRNIVQELARQSRPARSAPRGRDEARLLQNFSTSRLERWRRKLVRHIARLKQTGTRRRHRLRMRAKRFKYALEWSQAVLRTDRPALRKQIEQARIVQNALGKLNDGATHRAQAKNLRLTPLPRMTKLDRRKSRRKLLRDAEGALEKLGKGETG
jgi:CHAD domain-containing protein